MRAAENAGIIAGAAALVVVGGAAERAPETMAWFVWLAMFVVIEGQALFRKSYRGTLTAHLRDWFSMEGKGAWWRARRAVLLGFLAWLAGHLILPPGTF